MKHQKTFKKAAALALAATFTLSLAACSGGGGEGTAVLYTPNTETAVNALQDEAAAQNLDVSLDVVSGGSTALLERLTAEAGDPAADIFWATSAANFARFAEVFEPYESPELSGLDAELIPEGNLWAPNTTHVITLIVNESQTGDLPTPTSWADLTDPGWAGKITAADPAASSSALTAFYGAYTELGETEFAKLVENVVIARESNAVQTSVAQGEYAVGISYEAGVYPYIAGGQEGIAMIYPEDGVLAYTEGVGLVKNGPNPEAGKQFYDLLLSAETQERMLLEASRRPARNDIDVNSLVAELPNLQDLNTIYMDNAFTDDERDAFLELFASLS